jgi:hypothetical protein
MSFSLVVICTSFFASLSGKFPRDTGDLTLTADTSSRRGKRISGGPVRMRAFRTLHKMAASLNFSPYWERQE